MKYLVAVSGGVDSVVLLDMLAKRKQAELVVAHFDHGIRPDSADDAEFVKHLAGLYGMPFVSRREELGKQASEELARTRRYAFLHEQAKKYGATIVTAHHRDDLVETIAINIYRGTGWRGLAVFGDMAIFRPLLAFTKNDLYEYALKNNLEWVEDSTNRETIYLRNRMRIALSSIPAHRKRKLEELWKRQKTLRDEIDDEARMLIQKPYSRYFFTLADNSVAEELLRQVFIKEADKSLTRPQIERALLAIKTAKAAATFQVGEGISLKFTANTFVVQRP